MECSLLRHREQLCRKLEANFESIIAKYDRPFPDDDDLDLNTLEITTDRGKLKNLAVPTKFGSTRFFTGLPLTVESLSRQASADSALGSTNYSDSGDVDTSGRSYSSDSDSNIDSDGSGPSLQSPQRQKNWTKQKKQLDKSSAEVPSILSETSRFVERVQSFILENLETSSDDESTGIVSGDDEQTFKSTLLSSICRDSNSKPGFLNMTYNIDSCASVSEEPKDVLHIRCSSVPTDPNLELKLRQSSFNSEDTKIVPSAATYSKKFGSISEEPKTADDVSQRKSNPNLDVPEKYKQRKSHLLSNLLSRDVKMSLDTKYNRTDEKQKCTPIKNFVDIDSLSSKHELSPALSKPEYSDDAGSCFTVDTPRAKLYLNPKLTTPATPGCTTEDIIQFLNSPLDALVEQSNARARKSSKKHFSFSPNDINKHKKCHSSRKWHPESYSVEMDSTEIESMEVDTVIENQTNFFQHTPSNYSANTSASLLVSPLRHLQVNSPNYFKDHDRRHVVKKQSVNSRLVDNKSECFEKEHESDDGVTPLDVSDDNNPEQKQSTSNNSLSIYAQDFGINKITAPCKIAEDQKKLFTNRKKNGHLESNFIKPSKETILSKNGRKDQTRPKPNIKNTEESKEWWMKEPNLQGKRIKKTAARATRSSFVQENKFNNTYSWFVNKYPDESSIYQNDTSNISRLSVIPKIPEQSQSPANSDIDDDIVIKSSQQFNYCSSKKMSGTIEGDKVKCKPVHQPTPPVTRPYTSPKVHPGVPTLRTSTPARCKTTTSPCPRISTPTRTRNSTPPKIRTSTPRKSQPCLTLKHLSSKSKVNKPNKKTQANQIIRETILCGENVKLLNVKSRTTENKVDDQGKVNEADNLQVISSTRSGNSNTSNLSGSISCMGSDVCEKIFCFNCTFT